jgi:hypothetical protein
LHLFLAPDESRGALQESQNPRLSFPILVTTAQNPWGICSLAVP